MPLASSETSSKTSSEITFVTAFLLQDADRTNQAKIDSYLSRFTSLSSLNIQIVLFLDPQITVRPQPNLHIIPKSLHDTYIYHEYTDEPVLPRERNQQKDTAHYMMIQNAKVEFLLEASRKDPFQSQYFAWIDFGISHVLKQPATSLACLEALATKALATKAGSETLAPKAGYETLVASIHSTSHDQLFDRICWRFAGGFFLANKSSIENLYFAYCAAIKEIQPALTWEVNLWAWLEKRGKFVFNTYYGNHDDSMLINLPNQL